MKPTLYLETTIISYLSARPSRDIILSARQAITSEWWENSRKDYDLFISSLVIEEAKEGDREAAKKRMSAITGIQVLELNESIFSLAQFLIESKIIPERFGEDALHVAVCAVHNVDYLLTWNCKHLANVTLRRQMERIIENAGYQSPLICTPTEISEVL